MKNYFTILVILIFGFLCVSCNTKTGFKIAEEDFTQDCADKDCTKKNSSKDDFIRDEYLSKKDTDIFRTDFSETKKTVPARVALPVAKKKSENTSIPSQPLSVLFDFDKHALNSAGKAVLDKTAAILTAHPGYNIQIKGHTDNFGCHLYNVKLSQSRAEEAKKYLVGKGINSDRIITSWHSSDRPIASNETAGGRNKNRRVEFEFIKMS
jgi:outer membrane protein OmpA-like peptidoglycan-associated protein